MTSPLALPTEIALNLSRENWQKLTSEEIRSQFARLSDSAPAFLAEDRETLLSRLPSAKVLISGWGSAPLYSEDLEKASSLRLILHAAGSLKSAYPDLNFPAPVRVSTAAYLNARPVAEYTLGLILSTLRGAFTWTQRLREAGMDRWWDLHHSEADGYANRCIAIVGFGLIAKQLISLLRPFSFHVIVVSDFARQEDADEMGFEISTLEDAARRADVLSLHEADLPQFRHLINTRTLSLLKDGATLINTARGALVDEVALFDALSKRPLLAILDVVENEGQMRSHPLLELPNCFLTPHVAGAIRGEIKRFGEYVVNELSAFAENHPLAGEMDTRSLVNRA